METDTFQVGQWLRGRIYERRCDLSPHGEYFIYFALDGRWESEVKGSWTAISRSPYLKAIALWSKGDGWNGGGLFISDKSYWLNDGPYGHKEFLKTKELKKDKWLPSQEYGGECPGVYYHRLQRDGWVIKSTTRSEVVFERPFTSNLILRKIAHQTIDHPVGTGCYFDEYELIHKKPKRHQFFSGWEWADIDGDRIVFVENGKLWELKQIGGKLNQPKLLFDGNQLVYKRIKAPY